MKRLVPLLLLISSIAQATQNINIPFGATGATGAGGGTGVTGATGANGSAGSNGATGATGANGSNGAAGQTGATGASGSNGSNGAAGATGATGASGTNGSNGAAGLTGATGASGSNGSNGAAGSTGATGASGTNGSNGAAGATGATGAGTVTSVALTAPTGLSVSGSPITTSGTLALALSGQFPSSSMPAYTGDFTTSAGSTAATAAATQANIVTLSKSTGVAVHGTNTNDDAAAGYVGEYVESIVARASFVNCNNSSPVNITSIALTAGDWDVYVLSQIQATASFVGISLSISTTSTGVGTEGDNRIDVLTVANTTGDQGWFFSRRLSLSVSGTAYYTCSATASVSTFGKIFARRIR